jgi:hypothetical protein
VVKVWRMVVAEYKRRQAPPGIKITGAPSPRTALPDHQSLQRGGIGA